MRMGFGAMMAGLALAACGSEAPAPAPSPTTGSIAEEEALPVTGPPVRILAFGDSLFAGYNVAEGEGYPAVLQNVLRRRGIDATLVDAAVSGDTTQAALQRLDYVLANDGADVDLAIVELGGNDLLRSLPPEVTRRSLDAILAKFAEKGVPVLLMGMRAPPNLGADYVGEFDAIYPAMAERHDAALVPFFLEPVYDKPELIQPDRVHPTALGIEALVAASADAVVAALPEEARAPAD